MVLRMELEMARLCQACTMDLLCRAGVVWRDRRAGLDLLGGRSRLGDHASARTLLRLLPAGVHITFACQPHAEDLAGLSTPSGPAAQGNRSFRWTPRPAAPRLPLRILPLGDSITEGDKSSTGNGYRLDLLNELHARGNQDVHYVGSLHTGSMQNNDHEGYSGRSINQIRREFGEKDTLTKQPNVVLLHAGTNDMINDPPIDLDPYETGPERLGALMDEVLNIIKTILWWVPPERIINLNAKIPALVADRVAKGFKVMIVDMSSLDGTHGELDDGLHPNDGGYKLMAEKWADALAEADRRGLITPPIVVQGVS
nr:multidomain esterase [Quercus suber]